LRSSGVSTPFTITSSTPWYFQDANGNFIYGFTRQTGRKRFYAVVQAAVGQRGTEGADYVYRTAAPWQ
jgi:hypothetical protein